MSDFFSSGWSIYIAVATVVGLAACLLLLIVAARRRVMATDNSTGHVWDEDLRELNNPLPRWWMGLFVLTIVFSAGYLVVYPGLGSMAGTFGWTSLSQYQAEQAKARAAAAPLYASWTAAVLQASWLVGRLSIRTAGHWARGTPSEDRVRLLCAGMVSGNGPE